MASTVIAGSRFAASRMLASVAVTLRDVRCAMVNLDPDDARNEPRVLKAAAALNAVCAGVYAVVAATGTLTVGDAPYLA